LKSSTNEKWLGEYSHQPFGTLHSGSAFGAPNSVYATSLACSSLRPDLLAVPLRDIIQPANIAYSETLYEIQKDLMNFYLSSYKLGDKTKELKKLVPNNKSGYIFNALEFTSANPQKKKNT
jgi:hypothetical protein